MRRALVAVAVLGCWGGGSQRISSLGGDTRLETLSDAQLASLCGEIDGWSTRQYGSAAFRRDVCEVQAAVDLRLMDLPAGGRQSECRAAATACEPVGPRQFGVATRCQRWTGACPLTVNELEQCLTDLAYNMYGFFLSAPMCDDICREVDPLSLDAASCATVRATCPGFMFTRPQFPGLERTPSCR